MIPPPQEAPQAPLSKETFAHVATLVANHTLLFLSVLFGFQSPSCVTEGPSHLLTIETVPVWDVAGMYGCVLCGVGEENRPTPSQGGPELVQPSLPFTSASQTTKHKWSHSGGGEVGITRLFLNMASFALRALQPDPTSSSHTFGLRSFGARGIWVFKSHPFGTSQPDFSRDLRRRSTHTAGPLLREPRWLHGTVCWEAPQTAAGGRRAWPRELWGPAVAGCPPREQGWAWAAQLWAQLPADAAVGGLNAAQGALIYHLPPPPSDSGLDVCFVPRRGVSPDRGLL